MQALYNVKMALEKQQKAELAAADRRLQELERRLAQTAERIAFHRDAFNAQVVEGINSTQLAVYQTGFRALRETMEQQKENIATAENEKKRIQAKLVLIMQERKMLESLREKQWEEYKIESRMEETKTMEDFLGAREAKKKAV